MDRKQRNRILYVTVAILWAAAIYRTWQNFDLSGEEEQTFSQTFTPTSFQFRKDSFELILPDNDPFQISFEAQVQHSEQPDRTEKKVEQPKEKTIPIEKKWPSLQYLGFVRNRQVNSTLCLLRIDGKLVKLNPGETYKDMKIGQAFYDSVEVLFQGEKKIIKK